MQNQDTSLLIKSLIDCAIVNIKCVSDCLAEKEANMLMECVQLCQDCANTCTETARLLKTGSKMGVQYLALCEDLCRMCCVECAKQKNIKGCADCAEICKRCADACKARQAVMQN